MKSLLAASALLAIPGVASAATAAYGAAPGTGLVASDLTGSIGSRIFDLDANANHGRGMLFVPVDDGSASPQWSIQSVGFAGNDTLDYSGGTLILDIFQGSEAQWSTGTASATEGGSIYGGSTVTPLYQESFDLSGSPAANDYFTATLTTPVVVTEGGDYGFMFRYVADTAGPGPTSIFLREGGNGGRISVNTGGNGGASSRSLNYFVQGSPVPEPSSAVLLGLGGLAFILRRRK